MGRAASRNCDRTHPPCHGTWYGIYQDSCGVYEHGQGDGHTATVDLYTLLHCTQLSTLLNYCRRSVA